AGLRLFFELHHRSSNDEVLILFERRKSYKDENPVIIPGSSVSIIEKAPGLITGTVNIPAIEDTQLLVARVEIRGVLYYFDQVLNNNYPIDGYLINTKGEPILDNYITSLDSVGMLAAEIKDSLLTVFYYKLEFNASAAPMVENPRAEKNLVPDSIFQFNYFRTVTRFKQEGLYLVQADTNSAKGFAFRVENEFYPKTAKLSELPPPLVYITTKNEFNRLEQARSSKAEFDRIILDITKDAERARIFIRNYYRRVEMANEYFSSFKEGWKTDRGMILMIYGEPDEMFKVDGRETWVYPMGTQKLRFSFVRSGTIFDPENHILIRDKRLADSWFRNVDLWRKARL
ncbi:MAG TPA: GWxTD domain-containing protein, partial [Cyclobacteriaceae bacterium]|nr:GWxTD domain-containing protein [Cyclobacteriaceae bacterium]